MNEGCQDRVKYMVQVFTGILGKKSQNEISILLQQGIFPPVPPVRLGVSHMLRAIQLDHNTSPHAKEVHLHLPITVKRNWQLHVQAKAAGSLGQRLQTTKEKRFTGASGAIFSHGIDARRPGHMHEQICQGYIHPVANKPANTGGVIPFPFWINGKRNVGRPTRQSAPGQQDRVTERFISAAAFVEHPGQHGNIQIRVVIDAHFTLALVEAVKSPHILGNCSPP